MGDVVAVQDQDCTLRIFKRLRAGGLVNILFDAFAHRSATVLAFLGTRRAFATGFLRIARSAGCAVLPMACTGGIRDLRIRFEEPFDLEGVCDEDRFVSTHLPTMVRWLEREVLAYPEEWALWVVLD